MTPMTIDIHGRPNVFRVFGWLDSSHDAALVIDSAVKQCKEIWRPAADHAVDVGGVADEVEFEPEETLDAGSLASSLIRAASDAGYSLDIVGQGGVEQGREETHLILSQHDLNPRTLQVQMIEGAIETFRGRHIDFLGQVKG